VEVRNKEIFEMEIHQKSSQMGLCTERIKIVCKVKKTILLTSLLLSQSHATWNANKTALFHGSMEEK
jgi:hypothetical protein